MFETLKTFIAELTGEPAREDRFSDDDYRLAVAALLVRAATLDSGMSPSKRARLHAMMKDRFAFDDATATRLIEQAAEAEHSAVDLYHFTSRIGRSVNDEGRRGIVEMMWEIVNAGERIGDFEQNFIWRAADLLGVSSRERIALRRRTAARVAISHDMSAVAGPAGA